MLKGFRQFILRGNVPDLAVAVVMGAAPRTRRRYRARRSSTRWNRVRGEELRHAIRRECRGSIPDHNLERGVAEQREDGGDANIRQNRIVV